jgi:phage FluMu protein Com
MFTIFIKLALFPVSMDNKQSKLNGVFTMTGSNIRCVRCKGRKKLFKMNNGYSYTNTGGVEVKCPLCLGEGFTKPLEQAIEEIKEATSKHKSDKPTEKVCKDADKDRKNSDNYEEA